MKILNKLFTYSAAASTSLIIGLSASPSQVSAINLVGQTNTGLTAGTTNNTSFKGQSLDFTIGGNFAGSGVRPLVELNSIKFALGSTLSGLTATNFLGYIFDISLGLPSVANINAGTGAIATSAAAVAVNGDGSFGPVNSSYILLNFAGQMLDTTKTYGVFLDIPNITTGFTTSTNTAAKGIRSQNGNLYTGGNSFTVNGSGNLVSGGARDAAFIVDATPVPFEFEASGGVAILGGFFLAKKLKNRKQVEKV